MGARGRGSRRRAMRTTWRFLSMPSHSRVSSFVSCRLFLVVGCWLLAAGCAFVWCSKGKRTPCICTVYCPACPLARSHSHPIHAMPCPISHRRCFEPCSLLFIFSFIPHLLLSGLFDVHGFYILRMRKLCHSPTTPLVPLSPYDHGPRHHYLSPITSLSRK